MSGVCKKSSAYLCHGASTTKACVKSKACGMSDPKHKSKSSMSVCKKGDGMCKKMELHGTFNHVGDKDHPKWGSQFGWKVSSTK